MNPSSRYPTSVAFRLNAPAVPFPSPIPTLAVDGWSVRLPPELFTSAPSSIASANSVTSPLSDETLADVIISFVVTFSVTSPVPFAPTASLAVRFPAARTEMLPLLAVLSPSRPLTLPRMSAFDSLT